MGRPVADDRLLAIFLEELDERVRALNNDALALDTEASGDAGPADCAARVSTLLRTAHSLKGAAHSVNLGPVERACHLLEEVLLAVQSERVPAGRELCTLLLGAADAIEDAGARVRARQDLDEAPIMRLLPRLEAAAASGFAPLAAPPAPATLRSGEAASADGTQSSPRSITVSSWAAAAVRHTLPSRRPSRQIATRSQSSARARRGRTTTKAMNTRIVRTNMYRAVRVPCRPQSKYARLARLWAWLVCHPEDQGSQPLQASSDSVESAGRRTSESTRSINLPQAWIFWRQEPCERRAEVMLLARKRCASRNQARCSP